MLLGFARGGVGSGSGWWEGVLAKCPHDAAQPLAAAARPLGATRTPGEHGGRSKGQ
jgi:hypothetical protein